MLNNQPYRLVLSFIGLLAMVVLSPFVFAEKSVNIYSTSTFLLDESDVLRQQAMKTGLAEVVVRASADPQAIDNHFIKAALAEAENYVYQYAYESTDKTLTILGAEKPAVHLLIDFSVDDVQQLLASAELPIWPARRPEVLLWLAANSESRNHQQQERVLLEGHSDHVKVFKQAAVSYGLPLSSPLLDLADRQQLSIARLWAMDDVAISTASARYPVDAVLAGRLRQDLKRQEWQGDFILLHQGRKQYFTERASTSAMVAKKMLQQASAYLSRIQIAELASDEHAPSLAVKVENITSFVHYGELMDYINALPMVNEVVVANVKGQQLTLEIIYNGALSKLTGMLERSQKLQQMPSITVDSKQFSVFSWR